MRYGSTNPFSLYMSPDMNDVSANLPPAPIVDLTFTNIKYNLVTLQFTTSGADYDVGEGNSACLLQFIIFDFNHCIPLNLRVTMVSYQLTLKA